MAYFDHPHSIYNGLNSARFTGVANLSLGVKAAPTNIYGLLIYNPNPVGAFVKFYNVTGNVISGTTPVAHTVQVPANANVYLPPSPVPLFNQFSVGCCVNVTPSLIDGDGSSLPSGVYVDVIFA